MHIEWNVLSDEYEVSVYVLEMSLSGMEWEEKYRGRDQRQLDLKPYNNMEEYRHVILATKRLIL